MERTPVDFIKFVWTYGFMLTTVCLYAYERIDIKAITYSFIAFAGYHIFMGFTTGWGYNDLSIIASYILLAIYLPKFIKKYKK